MGYACVMRLHTHRDSQQIHTRVILVPDICTQRGKKLNERKYYLFDKRQWKKSWNCFKTIFFQRLYWNSNRDSSHTDYQTLFFKHRIFGYISTLVIRYRIARIFQLTLPVIVASIAGKEKEGNTCHQTPLCLASPHFAVLRDNTLKQNERERERVKFSRKHWRKLP